MMNHSGGTLCICQCVSRGCTFIVALPYAYLSLVLFAEKAYTNMHMMYKNYWMRNQSPEDASSVVPWHLQEELEKLSQQVREASEELNRLDVAYNEMILARIAMQGSFGDTTAWETLKEERNQAQKRYVALLATRLAFTRQVNGEQ
jgi:hypothetical protein